jgi:heat shock protein HslJ
MMKQLVIIGVIALVLTGCSPKLSPDNNWGNRRWVLIELKEVPVQLSGGNRDAHIEFTPYDKKFTGNAGCNRMNGSYSIDNKTIRFTDVITTKMSCPDISFENTFLDALNKVNRYEVNDNVMLLKDEGKVLLMFRER